MTDPAVSFIRFHKSKIFTRYFSTFVAFALLSIQMAASYPKFEETYKVMMVAPCLSQI